MPKAKPEQISGNKKCESAKGYEILIAKGNTKMGKIAKKIVAVDLFCGVGGLTCGLRKAGIDVAAGIDIDPSCKFPYESNNKAKFYSEDINKFSSSRIKRLWKGADYTLLAGCAPCQPFSNQQKDKTHRDKKGKWKLLKAFSAKVTDLKPDIVSMENVPELKGDSVFRQFVRSLVKDGYSVSYKVVNAADYGVPQRRMRLLLLASRLGKIELIQPDPSAKKITVKDAIGALPKISSGGSDPNDPLHVCRKLSSLNIKRIQASSPGSTWEDWPRGLRPKCYLRKTGQTYKMVYGRMSWDKLAPTLTTQFTNYGTGRYGHPEQDRAISLREGALIQTFPADYRFFGEGTKPNLSAIARQIGNAVPVRLGEVIGESIVKHLCEVKRVGENGKQIPHND
jgi:DNA (cytosine-5)-methyltransferase 1